MASTLRIGSIGGKGLHVATLTRHSIQFATRASGEKDHPVPVPCATARQHCIAEYLGRTASEIHPLESSLSKEANRTAIRRPERVCTAVGPRQRLGRKRDRRRTQRRCVPSGPVAERTTRRPSGDIVTGPPIATSAGRSPAGRRECEADGAAAIAGRIARVRG